MFLECKIVMFIAVCACILHESSTVEVEVSGRVSIGDDLLKEFEAALKLHDMKPKQDTEHQRYQLLNRFKQKEKEKRREERKNTKRPPPQMPMPKRNWLLEVNMTRDYVMKKLNVFIGNMLRRNATLNNVRPRIVMEGMRQAYLHEFSQWYRRFESRMYLPYWYKSNEWIDYITSVDTMFQRIGIHYMTKYINMLAMRGMGRWQQHHKLAINGTDFNNYDPSKYEYITDKPTRSFILHSLSGLMCRDFQVCGYYRIFSDYLAEWLSMILSVSAKKRKNFFVSFVGEFKRSHFKMIISEQFRNDVDNFVDKLKDIDDDAYVNLLRLVRLVVVNRYREIETHNNELAKETQMFRRVLVLVSKAYLRKEIELATVNLKLEEWFVSGKGNVKSILRKSFTQLAYYYPSWTEDDKTVLESDVNVLVAYLVADRERFHEITTIEKEVYPFSEEGENFDYYDGKL